MLKGKQVILRAPEPEDADILYAWENDETLWHLSNTVTPFSRFDIEQFILSAQKDIYANKQLRLMIVKTDGEKKIPVGSIDLFDFDPLNSRAGVGIMIVEKERKKGYAAESLNLIIEYCFENLQLHQLYCNILVDNEASLRLFRKTGFTIIGTKKEWIRIKNKWVDEYLLQLVNTHSSY